MEMVNRKGGVVHYKPSREGHVNAGMDSGDYLHPEGQTSPVKTSPPQSLADVKFVNMRNTRFDSGVADLDAVNTEVPQHKTSTGHPVNPKNYDYADYGGHQYEELPQSRASMQKMSPELDSRSEYQSSAGTVTAGTPSDSGDTAAIVRNGEQRKRFNPLYDTMISSSPSIYNKVKATKESHTQQQLRLLKIIVIILILISCLSLAISLYLVIVYTAGPVLVKNLQEELESLQLNQSALNHKMKMLESLVSGNSSIEHLVQLSNQVSEMESHTVAKIDVLEKNLFAVRSLIQQNNRKIDSVYQNASLRINATEQELSLISSNFTSALEILHQGIQDELNIISKMQGPPGVGNLSACYMRDFTSISASSRPITNTYWVPSSEELKKEVVMFGFCQVLGGTTQNLETKVLTGNHYQYRCSCHGTVNGMVDRTCKLHLWVCPRESFGGVS